MNAEIDPDDAPELTEEWFKRGSVYKDGTLIKQGLQTNIVLKADPILTAQAVLAARYPEAIVGFAGGSFNRGEATAYSDIDLVVVFETLDNAWRESFIFDGWLVETFVHDLETLPYFFAQDRESGTPVLATMITEGPMLPAGNALGQP